MRSGSRKYKKTQSRYKDLKRASHSNCHRHCHEEEDREQEIALKLASYAPLRSNNGGVVQNELERADELSPIKSLQEVNEQPITIKPK